MPTPPHRDPGSITGYTAQQGASGSTTFTNTSLYQAHGNPGPQDVAGRAGYLMRGEPGGIDPLMPGEGGTNLTVKGDTPPARNNPYGDPTNVLGPMSKHGWTSQAH